MHRYIKTKLILFIIFSICITFFSCEKTVKKNKTQSTEKLGKVVFYDSSKVKNLEIIVEVVEDEYHRSKGLMFRENLPINQGMFFIFENEALRHFWMKNTNLSLDIIYLDASLNIVSIHRNTIPHTEKLYPSDKPAMYVIEVRAGFTDLYQVNTGHSVSFELL